MKINPNDFELDIISNNVLRNYFSKLSGFHKDITEIYLKIPEKNIGNIYNKTSKKPDAIHFSKKEFGLIEKKKKNYREKELIPQIEESIDFFNNKFNNSNKTVSHKINYIVLIANKVNNTLLSKSIKNVKNKLIYRKTGKPYTIRGLNVYFSKNEKAIK